MIFPAYSDDAYWTDVIEQYMDPIKSTWGVSMEQKIKQDIHVGENIRKICKAQKLEQTDLVHILQIDGCDMTRECLVKIERCTQHIRASQL